MTSKIAVSNIAWQAPEDESIAALLQRLGIRGVEIAPTKMWPDPLRTPEARAKDCRSFWEKRDVSIVAMQSLLFGRPDLVLFGTETKRRELLDYLKGMLRLGQWLGAKIAVFGSPSNRRRGEVPLSDALQLATPFFNEIGAAAEECGMIFCIEANPPAYGCDFLTSSSEVFDFTGRINNPGLGLHLDAAAMALSQEAVPQAVLAAGKKICHFHASEKELGLVGSGTINHRPFAAALRQMDYANWVSIEMRAGETGNVERVEKALKYVQSVYSLTPNPSS